MNFSLIRIKESIGINASILIGCSIILILSNYQVLALCRHRFLLAANQNNSFSQTCQRYADVISLALANF